MNSEAKEKQWTVLFGHHPNHNKPVEKVDYGINTDTFLKKETTSNARIAFRIHVFCRKGEDEKTSEVNLPFNLAENYKAGTPC